jgi:HEAT repeat protein
MKDTLMDNARIQLAISGLNEAGTRHEVTHQLASYGLQAVPSLIDVVLGAWRNEFGATCENDWQRRGGAIIALRLMGPLAASSVVALTTMLSHEHWGIRVEAALALESIGVNTPAIVGALESLVAGDDLHTRGQAAQALQVLRDLERIDRVD